MFHCSYSNLGASDEGGSPQDPPFPRTESILPLVQGNIWRYSFTAYDSTGKMIEPHQMDLIYEVNAQYGMSDDTTLVKITMNNYRTTFKTYAYQYTVEQRDSGYLLTYRQLYPLGKRGVYIIGYNDHGTNRLYPQEQLWLAYPADSGYSWRFMPDPENDTSTYITMEVIATHAQCMLIDSTTMKGMRFIDSCYLYKETAGEWVSYYYYHPSYGAIAYQRYFMNRLRRTYILKSFTVHFERNYE
jgi:hypothetical protein